MVVVLGDRFRKRMALRSQEEMMVVMGGMCREEMELGEVFAVQF